jgi:hypothetical protein
MSQSSGLDTKYGIHVMAIMKRKDDTGDSPLFRLARVFIRAHIGFTREFREVSESVPVPFALIRIEVGLTPLY